MEYHETYKTDVEFRSLELRYLILQRQTSKVLNGFAVSSSFKDFFLIWSFLYSRLSKSASVLKVVEI